MTTPSSTANNVSLSSHEIKHTKNLRIRSKPKESSRRPQEDSPMRKKRKASTSSEKDKCTKSKNKPTKVMKYNKNWSEELGITDHQLSLLPQADKCIFCHFSDDNPDLYGKLITHTYTGEKNVIENVIVLY